MICHCYSVLILLFTDNSVYVHNVSCPKDHLPKSENYALLKGSLTGDFLLQVFIMIQFPPEPPSVPFGTFRISNFKYQLAYTSSKKYLYECKEQPIASQTSKFKKTSWLKIFLICRQCHCSPVF
jgi:hypothetical protein